jgi:hypothetical protein
MGIRRTPCLSGTGLGLGNLLKFEQRLLIVLGEIIDNATVA